MTFFLKDIKRLLNKLGLFSEECGEDDSESRRNFDDDYLNFQSAFHDLFEWLTVTEEDLRRVSTSESDVKEARQRFKTFAGNCGIFLEMFELHFYSISIISIFQDSCRQIQKKKSRLDDLDRRSKKFLDLPGENIEENVTELRHLWRDVMLKVCAKIRELQKLLHVLVMRGLEVEGRDEVSKTLSDSELDVKDLVGKNAGMFS